MKSGATRKTYWHLAEARRLPSEYEVVTSRLLYYVDRGGFSVTLPAASWYRRFQTESPLACAAWEEFADPRATTYASYVALQRDAESYVARLLDPLDVAGYDEALPGAWLDTLERSLSPLRFALHGQQMAAAYIGQMAPSGRIVVTALLETADDVRRIGGLARRLGQIRRLRPAAGADGRERWQSDPAWQPLRKLVETLLVTYDWGEALVALNLCVKPRLDALFLGELARLAEARADYVGALFLRAYEPDAAWQLAWTERLLRLAIARGPSSAPAIEAWVARWRPLADEAVASVAAVFGDDGALAARNARAGADSLLRGLGTAGSHDA